MAAVLKSPKSVRMIYYDIEEQVNRVVNGASLNPRIKKQLNLEISEVLHCELKQLVATMPGMSMQRFVIETIEEKMKQLAREGREDKVAADERPEVVATFLDLYEL